MNNRIDIDFDIVSSLYYLKVIDMSCWGIIENKPAVIEITMPGYTHSINKYFNKKDTVYDAYSLNMICEDSCEKVELPDGIYHILIKGSPSSYQKEYDYLKADQLVRDLDIALIKSLEKGCHECNKKDVLEAKYLLEVARAYIRSGMVKKASEYYKMARKISDRLKNCKDC
jgi:hypothetical protein